MKATMILESYFGASLGLCYSEDAECTRLNILPQFKRLLKFGVSADFPCIIDTAAEKMGFERRFLITVDPSLKPTLGALGRILLAIWAT